MNFDVDGLQILVAEGFIHRRCKNIRIHLMVFLAYLAKKIALKNFYFLNLNLCTS